MLNIQIGIFEMIRAFLSLGSNIGDRLSNIQHTVRLISMTKETKVIKTSSFYETEPWGIKEQDWFVNAAVAIDTNLEPLELLDTIHNIEKQLGRKREIEKKWHERTIDIDILMYGNQIIDIPEKLTIPHPYMHKRAFVLVPMLEVKSDLVHPILNKTISQLYDELNEPEGVFLYGTIKTK